MALATWVTKVVLPRPILVQRELQTDGTQITGDVLQFILTLLLIIAT